MQRVTYDTPPHRKLRWNPPVRWIAKKWARLEAFKPKIILNDSCGPFTVRTAQSASDLQRIFYLRYLVFTKELQGRIKLLPLEMDANDLEADHLMVIDSRTQQVVGTYRFFSNQFNQTLYSQSEFKIDSFLKTSEGILELGRACILPSHRTGMILHLLWQGIAQYMEKINARYLVGCTSVPTVDEATLFKISLRLLAEGATLSDPSIRPFGAFMPVTKTFECLDELKKVQSSLNDLNFSSTPLPPLFESYLKAGAKFAPIPGIDHAFRCADYFTVVDRMTMTEKFLRRYFSGPYVSYSLTG